MTAAGPRRPSDLSNWVVFALLGAFWGSSYLFIKIGVETLPTFTLIAGRLGIGSLVLATALLASRTPLPRDRRIYGRLVLLALVNVVLPFSLITWGERSISSALAAILNATIPLFTIVFAALALHDEPISANRLAGLAVGFVGVVVLTSRSLGGEVGGGAAGELAMIGASAAYATGNVYTRRHLRGLHPTIPAFFQVFIAFLVTGTLALLLDRPWTIALQPEAAFSVAWLGIVGSGFAYLAFFHLIRTWGSTRTSLTTYVIPVVAIALGYLVLGETLDARIVLGTGLIIGGIGLVNSRYGRRALAGRGRRGAGQPGVEVGASGMAAEPAVAAAEPGVEPAGPAARPE